MGLTWIDYDTIEKPIEEITVCTGEAKDIEFTVETLKCDIKKPGNGLTKKVEHKNWFVLLVAEGSAHGHAKSIFLSQNTGLKQAKCSHSGRKKAQFNKIQNGTSLVTEINLQLN